MYISDDDYESDSSNDSYPASAAASRRTDDAHFDSGIYEFNKIILGWGQEEIDKPCNLSALRSHYSTAAASVSRHYDPYDSDDDYDVPDSTSQYYARFKPHILEEARAILAAGIEAINDNKTESFEVTITYITIAKNSNNPSSIKVTAKLPKDTEGRSCMAMLLTNGAISFIAIGAEEGIDSGVLRIKFIADGNRKFNQGQKLKAYVLGSLVSHQRMYEVCTTAPRVSFLQNIISGTLPAWQQPNIYSLTRALGQLNIGDTLDSLNASQSAAIKAFLAARDGLYVLQGPPGTGKTTTNVEILNLLAKQNKRVMLCAPSNKAVQVIATRFLEKYPETAMALAGVESKLTENLREIFIHDWGNYIASRLIEFKRQVLWQLNLQQLLNLKLKNFDAIETAMQTKLTRISENDIAAITNIVSLRAPSVYRVIYGDVKAFIDSVIKYKQYLNILDSAVVEQYRVYIHKQNQTKSKKGDQEREVIEPVFLTNSNTFLSNLAYYIERIISTMKAADLEEEMLNAAKVIFCTLSVAGRSMMKDIKDIDVLIVDEAGQSVEAETLIPLSLNPKKCLLVGDVNQLPATVISPQAEKNNFAWSMMWRLIVECRQNYQMLTMQYRMHPHIRQWPSQQYYGDRLEDSTHIATRQLPYKYQNNFLFSPYSFLNITSGHEERSRHSFINRKEAYAIIDTVRYLKNKCQINTQQHIGIITFYAAQVDLLKRLIKEKNLGNVRVHTVDGFQGDENDIIMISFVRSNSHATVGFLKDFRRLNVAITRPKHTLLVFGHLPTLERAHNADVSKLVADVQQRNLVHSEQEFNNIINPPAPVATAASAAAAAPAASKQAQLPQHESTKQQQAPKHNHQNANAKKPSYKKPESAPAAKKSHAKKPFYKGKFYANQQKNQSHRRDDDHDHNSGNSVNYRHR